MRHSTVPKYQRAAYCLVFVGLLLSAFNGGKLPAARAQEAAPASGGPQGAEFTLDGVGLSIEASALPSGSFAVAEPGSASQVATSASWGPFSEFSVTAIPFGSRAGTEALPAALPGSVDTYRAALREYRTQQGGEVADGSSATLFGQQVTGLRSLVWLHIDGPVPKPVTIEEWVVEAGDRLWIVRGTQEQVSGEVSAQGIAGIEGLTLSSGTLDQPTTVADPLTAVAASDLVGSVDAAALATPSWWSGDCDYNTYLQGSGGRASYRLGEVYQGMPACGPRPYSDQGPDVLVRFYPGSWGEYEWECVELAMRFLYLMYGIGPYQANGSQVVWNYSGTLLVKVANGTVGKAPQPNDVLSYGATSTSGHTAVVTSSAVDAIGNGTVTVIEQNSSVSGRGTLTVNNWTVSAYSGAISGWLHDASSDGTPTPTPTPGPTPDPTTVLNISGNAGVAGVTVSYDDAGPQVVTADASGNYSFQVSGGWSGTVTPSKGGVTFIPANRSYTDVTADQVGQDYDRLLTQTLSSSGAQDGRIIESSETSGQGGKLDSTATTLRIGDNSADAQQRAILSFNTAGLPDNAVITQVTLRFKKQGVVGTDPFTTHGYLLADIRKGGFSSNSALQLVDFQATSSRDAVMSFTNNPVNGWYSNGLAAAYFEHIKKTGVTQFRLRFALQDNDDLGADYLSCYSGNATSADRPKLIIQYYVP